MRDLQRQAKQAGQLWLHVASAAIAFLKLRRSSIRFPENVQAPRTWRNELETAIDGCQALLLQIMPFGGV